MIKKIIISSLFLSSFSSYAFNKEEWVNFISDAVQPNDNLTWTYDMSKMKSYEKFLKRDDIIILKDIAKSIDLQVSQGAKYLLASSGKEANAFLFENYLDSKDLKNGLYYLNYNLMNTPDATDFWQNTFSESTKLTKLLLTSYNECKTFNNYYGIGGKDFTFKNYDDFYSQRSLLSNYTHADLFYLEIDLQDKKYPVTVTFYKNRYTIQSKENDTCVKINNDKNYIRLQKISALYKQYSKNDLMKPICDSFHDNKLLSSHFNYFCNDLNIK